MHAPCLRQRRRGLPEIFQAICFCIYGRSAASDTFIIYGGKLLVNNVEIEAIKREIESMLSDSLVSRTADPAVTGADVICHLEHSLLNPDTTLDTIMRECEVARRVGCAAVCVAPYYVSAAKIALFGSNVAVGTAVGFPHGCMSTAAKLAELQECIANGAQEIDVALNNLAIKSGKLGEAKEELKKVLALCKGRALVKVVFEHGIFDEVEKKNVLKMIRDCGAGFIKIQNMLSGHGARVEDVRLASCVLGCNVEIKIDGGIKTLEQAQQLLAAGASRLGLTATEKIAAEAGMR